MSHSHQPDMLEIGAIFDKHVPIITTEIETGLRTDVYITREITADVNKYIELVTLLNNSSDGDIIYFNLNTPGGALSTTMFVMEAMMQTNATTIAKITGEVASAGTMFALACDTIEADVWGSMMIHNYSGGVYGKGHEVESQVSFEVPHLRKFFIDVYTPFLTKKECKKVLDGKDLYLNADEINRRLAIVDAKAEKEAAKHIKKLEKEQTEGLVDYLAAQGYIVTKEKKEKKAK